MSTDADKSASPKPNQVESTESQSTKEPRPTSPKKKSWRDWLLILVAAMTLGNGVAEITDMRRINLIATRQTEISQRLEHGNSSPDQQSTHYLLGSTQGQVTAMKEFMARNQAEIKTVDHDDRQLTLLAQTAIDIANETIAKRNTDDALSKAIKNKVQLLESLLAREQQIGQKRKSKEVYELVANTEDLLKLCGPFMAKTMGVEGKRNEYRFIPMNNQV